MTPPFYIVMIFLFIMIVIAVDRRSWGQWASAGWTDLGATFFDHREHDIEIRARYRRMAFEHVPKIPRDAIVKFPDPTLDSMIFEERFKDANEYRMHRMKEARDRHDADALENYEIYKAIISASEAAANEHSRRTLRERFPEIREGTHGEGEKKKYDPMEILESSNKKPREKIRSGFLEIASRGIPRPPLKKPEEEIVVEPPAVPVRDKIEAAPVSTERKVEEIIPEEIRTPEFVVKDIGFVEPVEEKTGDDEDYTGLITI